MFRKSQLSYNENRSQKIDEIKRHIPCYLMIAPFMLLFLFFIVLPIIASFFISLTDFDMVGFPRLVGFDNYLRIFVDDEDFIISFRNTLALAVVTGPIGYFACLLIAWLINEFNPGLRSFLTVCFYAPTISGTLYVIWAFIFSGDQYGILNSFLINLGFLDEPFQWLTDTRTILPIVMIVQVWMSLGSAFLSFIAGLQGVPKSIYEAGAVDGVKNRWQELFYLTLPSMGPQLLFGAVMQIAAAFAIGPVLTALCGYPTTDNAGLTMTTLIADYGTMRYEMGYACALSFVLFIIIILTHKLVETLINKYASA